MFQPHGALLGQDAQSHGSGTAGSKDAFFRISCHLGGDMTEMAYHPQGMLGFFGPYQL